MRPRSGTAAERTVMKRPRLLLADDHTLVVEGLAKILGSEFDPVGTAENGRELLRLAEELKPDVVLLDISMPLLNGLDACKQLIQVGAADQRRRKRNGRRRRGAS